MEEFTTEADFQWSCYWQVMSVRWASN